MHYLITGGAGFIGSHLSDQLLDRGDRVTVIDDLSTGSIHNIAHLRSHPRFRYVIDTMMNAPLLAELVDEADAVFHLAAAVGVQLIVESPVRTIETNIRATDLLLAVAEKKRKKVLISSTSEVYGKSDALPFREDGDLVLGATTRGRWSYACSKAIDEFLAIAYWRERHLPTTIVRLFNTVGPRQTGRYGMVVPRFVRQAVEGEADHRLRRRLPETVLHACLRFGAGTDRLDGERSHRRRGLQHRHPGGGHDPAARRAHASDDGVEIGDHLRAVRGGL